jgi:hypothetical protein
MRDLGQDDTDFWPSHFENVLHLWDLPIVKHNVNVIMNINICISQGICIMERFLHLSIGLSLLHS